MGLLSLEFQKNSILLCAALCSSILICKSGSVDHMYISFMFRVTDLLTSFSVVSCAFASDMLMHL